MKTHCSTKETNFHSSSNNNNNGYNCAFVFIIYMLPVSLQNGPSKASWFDFAGRAFSKQMGIRFQLTPV